MKTHAARLAIALTTFAAGVCLATLMFSPPAPVAPAAAGRELKYEYIEIQSYCGPDGDSKGGREETAEETAARLAEEFVARHGYTDLPPDSEGHSYLSVERAREVDGMLEERRGSLERKAYGIRYTGRAGGPGWTVVFRHKRRYGNELDRVGRGVTLDWNFENPRVEHKSFPLGNVDKKF